VAPRPLVADLRADAGGHGLLSVASVLDALGVSCTVGDETDATRRLVEAGIRPTTSPPTLDHAALFGLPRSGAAPALRVSGRVLSTKPLRAGEGVSYNHTHRAATDTHVALVTGGFGHGIPRALGNHAHVEIGGRLFPIVGRVAMDVCVVDIAASTVPVGTEVVYFGGTGPARFALDAWERITGWTGAELVCAIGLRVPTEMVA
jgi:alanine racemase